MNPMTRTMAFSTAVLLMAALSPLAKADIFKADNTDNLNLDSSWTTVQPTASDVAVWDNNVTAANTVLLGDNLSWLGIRIADPAGQVTISAGNTLTIGSSGIDMSATAVKLLLANAVTLGANQTWNIAATKELEVSGRLTGTQSIIVDGGGTVRLSNNSTTGGSSNTFGGVGQTITVQGGSTLRTTSNSNFASLGSTSNKIILSGGTYTAGGGNDFGTSFNRGLEFVGSNNFIRNDAGASSRELWIASVLSGSGSFSTSGTDAPNIFGNLSGDSTFSGTATAASQTLYIGANAARDALASGNVTLSGASVHFGGNSATPVDLAAFNRTLTVNSNHGLSVANNYTFNLTGTLTGSANLSINNITLAQESKGSVAAIAGAGVNSVVVLNGDLSGFTGNVTVTRGTLLIGNSVGSAANLGATGTMTVASGATLGGHGTIIRNVTIDSGDILAPGASAGSLEFGGDLAINNAASTTAIQLGGILFDLNVTEQYDRIKLTGATPTLTLNGILDVSLIDSFVLGDGQSFGIIQLGDGASLSGTFSGLATDGSLVGNFSGKDLFITYSANFGDSGPIALSGGNDIALYTVVIPEPASLALLGLCGLLMLPARKRGRRQA